MEENADKNGEVHGGRVDPLVSRVLQHFSLYNNIKSVREIERTKSKGYWRVKAGCPGGSNCCHAFRAVMGSCNGNVELLLSFEDHENRDNKGRFVSPYLTWEAWGRMYG